MQTRTPDLLKLKNVLAYPTVTMWDEPDGGNFSRNIVFTANNKIYRIEWWCNQCYLYVGDIIIPFMYVIRTNTWPNHAKMNLQFYDKNDEVVAIVAIEHYDRKDEECSK